MDDLAQQESFGNRAYGPLGNEKRTRTEAFVLGKARGRQLPNWQSLNWKSVRQSVRQLSMYIGRTAELPN